VSAALAGPLAAGDLALVPLTPAHRADLKAACAADPAIWAIYPVSWAPDRFDATFDAALADATRLSLAILVDGTLAGMTAWLGIGRPDVIQIGGSYLHPAHRGTGLNRRVKALMLDHAFAHGIRRVEFRVDVRNARSQAAVTAIGGVREGVLRQELETWTGHIRDTAVFSILATDPRP